MRKKDRFKDGPLKENVSAETELGFVFLPGNELMVRQNDKGRSRFVTGPVINV
jgi:hypothetical protein